MYNLLVENMKNDHWLPFYIKTIIMFSVLVECYRMWVVCYVSNC